MKWIFVIVSMIAGYGFAQEDPIEEIRANFKDTEAGLSSYKKIIISDWYDEDWYNGEVPEYEVFLDTIKK